METLNYKIQNVIDYFSIDNNVPLKNLFYKYYKNELNKLVEMKIFDEENKDLFLGWLSVR